MEKYTIYCTKEQTKRAFDIGAPIYTTNEHLYRHPDVGEYWAELDIIGDPRAAKIPTAEQMIGWMEEQGIAIDITMASKKTIYYTLTRLTDIGSIYIKGRSENDYASRKEATLAAIDTALDYLINNKK